MPEFILLSVAIAGAMMLALIAIAWGTRSRTEQSTARRTPGIHTTSQERERWLKKGAIFLIVVALFAVLMFVL